MKKMKFSFKISCFFSILIVLFLGIGGFLIINSCFINELEINRTNALKDNEFLATIYSNVLLNDLDMYANSDVLKNQIKSFTKNGEIYIGGIKDLKYIDNNKFIKKLKTNEQGIQLIDINNLKYIQVISKLNILDEDIYLENIIDVNNIYELRDRNYKIYCNILIILTIISSIIIYIFSRHITKPLEQLKNTSSIIASGNFHKRIDVTTNQTLEFLSIAEYFNNMADQIENYINELQDYNKRQDDFVSRFTHELKTPLTSIIGYADFLRTYEVDEKQKYEMTSYIYKEGKRLENLSHNLLDLIVLKKDDFELKRQNSKVLFLGLKKSLIPLLDKYGVSLELDIDEEEILVEPSLIKSLLYNLIDNSCKAVTDNKKIILSGKKNNNKYVVSVKDFGKGIPKESIDKVTEAFYMVDKSRARKQGGAGIGLSLCNEIARIHHSSLSIKSKINEGTKISIELEIYNEEE